MSEINIAIPSEETPQQTAEPSVSIASDELVASVSAKLLQENLPAYEELAK